jgi:hypothetical protein
MAPIARIIGLSLATAALGIVLGYAILGQNSADCTGVCFLLACVGAVVGAVAGAGREIASALR